MALTIVALVSSGGAVNSIVSAAADALLPGPTAAERAVGQIYEEIETSPFWDRRPTMSSTSERLLIDDWESFRTDEPHRFLASGARRVGLDELLQNEGHDGHPVLVRAYVAQLFPVGPVEGQADLVTASFRLSVAGSAGVAWCGRSTYHRDDVPWEDQLVDAGDAVEVAELFRAEESSRMWLTQPSLSSRARHFLMREWDRLTPYRPHPFPRHRVKRIGIDQVYEDRRFDARLLAVSGYITQRLLQSGGEGMLREQIRLQTGDQGDTVWCRTTLPSWRAFREDELVEAVGVPYARGAAKLESGGYRTRRSSSVRRCEGAERQLKSRGRVPPRAIRQSCRSPRRPARAPSRSRAPGRGGLSGRPGAT